MVLQKFDLCKHFTAFDLSHSFQIMLKKKEVYFDVCVFQNGGLSVVRSCQ